jgi:hypothetical protein
MQLVSACRLCRFGAVHACRDPLAKWYYQAQDIQPFRALQLPTTSGSQSSQKAKPCKWLPRTSLRSQQPAMTATCSCRIFAHPITSPATIMGFTNAITYTCTRVHFMQKPAKQVRVLGTSTAALALQTMNQYHSKLRHHFLHATKNQECCAIHSGLRGPMHICVHQH